MRLILATLCVLCGAGYVSLAGWYPDVAWLQEPVVRLLWPALVGAAAVGGIACAGRFRPADPLIAAWTTTALAGSLLLLPLILAREQQAVRDNALQQRVVSLRRDLRQERLRLEQIREAEEADRRERAKTDRFALYEGRVPDDKLALLRELDARMHAEVETQAAAYKRVLDANPTRGPDDWVRFRTLDELAVERAAYQAIYEQTRNFTQFVESFADTYSKAIADLDVPPPADRVAIAEMERILQAWERARAYDLRKLDVEFLAAGLQALDALRDAWGDWSYNPRENQLSFADTAREAAFQQALQRMQDVAHDIARIRENLPGAE